jgi:hypothetical protein
MSDEYYYEQQAPNQNIEEEKSKKCDKCNSEDETYYLSCNHYACLDCLFANSISSNFKGLSCQKNILFCPVCNEGKVSFQSNQDWINALKKLIDNKNENNRQPSNDETIKGFCSKHKGIIVEDYCPLCKKWLCAECKNAYHNEYFPEHVLFDSDKINVFCSEHQDVFFDSFCLDCHKEICYKCIKEGIKHLNHKIITKNEYDKMKAKSQNKNTCLGYNNYSEMEQFLNAIEKKFFDEIQEDYNSKIQKIQTLIQSLEQLQNNYKAQVENFHSDMEKVFEILKLSYFNYFAMTEEQKKKITIANSLTDIAFISENIIDIEDMNLNFGKQLENYNNLTKENQNSCFTYQLIFNNNEMSKIKTLEEHEEGVTKLLQLHSGELASASIDSTIKIWEVNSSMKKPIKTLEGHKSSIWSLLETSSYQLISGSSDKTIKIWNVSVELCEATLKGHKGTIYSLAEMKSKNIISSSEDKTIRVWDISQIKKQCINVIYSDNKSKITTLNVLPDDYVISGDDDNTIKIWDIGNNEIIGELKGHKCTVWCICQIDDGNFIASGGSDNSIMIWDLINMACVDKLEGHENTVSCVKMMKNGLLISGSWDCTIRIWNLSTRLCVFVLQEHNGIVWDVIEMNDDKIVSAGNDKKIIVWEKK